MMISPQLITPLSASSHMPLVLPAGKPFEAGAWGWQTSRVPKPDHSDSIKGSTGVTLTASTSGLRPPKQLERSEMFIHRDGYDFGKV